MNCSIHPKYEKRSAIGVAFVLAMAMPLMGGPPDATDRTDRSAKAPTTLVISPPQQLQNQIVAGGPATAIIRFTPVATRPGGSYNTGGYYTNANISGQRLRVGFDGGRTYWNVQISGWAPDTMKLYQGTIGNDSLLGTNADCGGGPGSCPGAGNLTYALQPCSTSTDCTNAFGEPGDFGIFHESVCQDGFCHSIFVNTTRTDWTHASVSDAFGGYGVFSYGRAVYSLSNNSETAADTGLNYYAGTFVLDVPASARGVYTINWVASDTFLFDGSTTVIPLAAMIPGELEITCLCNANVNNDGAVNAIDEAIVLDCVHGDCGACVNDCDVNCDGAVDWVDMGITRCQLMGFLDCCNSATGACLGLNVGNDYEPCVVTTTVTCDRYQGTYLGDDTKCSGCVCNADVDNNGKAQVIDIACVRECAQYNNCACCVNSCDVNCDGSVDFTDLAATWCEFEGGSDCCNVAVGACAIPTGGWPECIETSKSACEFNGGTYYGNGSTCADLCPATRIFEDAIYCPGRVDLVRIELGALSGVSAIAVEDSPPENWTVSAISNGGSYDAVNHKVKWGPLFAPFPTELSYEVRPDNASTAQSCFSGILSADGVNNTTCGDDCMDYQCCPYIVAETPQPICDACTVGSCAECTNGSCQDGALSLCEVIAYGCAWVRGCNDDIASVTRAAFIWRNGECYCWDEVAQNFIPTACGSGNTCCPGSGAAAVMQEAPAILDSAPAGVVRQGLRAALGEWNVSIEVVPTVGTSAVAAELMVPKGWKVISVGENGAFDGVNGKIKWGPYFGDAARTLTTTVRPDVYRSTTKAVREPQTTDVMLHGTISIDGVNLPIVIGR